MGHFVGPVTRRAAIANFRNADRESIHTDITLAVNFEIDNLTEVERDEEPAGRLR